MGDKKPAEVRPDIKQAIEVAARTAAHAAIDEMEKQEGTHRETNHFRAMESLLWNYTKLRDRVADRDAYMRIDIQERSKSVTVAPPKGQTYKDHDEVLDEIYRMKAMSYAQTLARFEELDGIVKQFRERQEFVVVRMYYFNENLDGSQREEYKQRRTWEEITEELSKAGVLQNVKTARKWRSQIVADMAVCMFGAPAALTTQTRGW